MLKTESSTHNKRMQSDNSKIAPEAKRYVIKPNLTCRIIL